MNEPTCPAGTKDGICGRPTDMFLCRRCASVLERILAELPATLDDLQTTITRQSRTSKGGGGKPTKASEAPLPFDVHASAVLDRTRNGMSTWIRHVVETRGVETHHGPMHMPGGCQHSSCLLIRNGVPVITRTQDMATWLVTHIQSILADEWAPQLLADLKQLQYELRAAVDNREYRYAGPCTAVLQMGEVYEVSPDVVAIRPTTRETCGADLKAREGAKSIVCRTCGAEYDVAERGEWIDKRAAEEMAPASVIVDALNEAGYHVKAATVRKWAERTLLSQAEVDRRARLIAEAVKADEPPPDFPPFTYEEFPIHQVACSVFTRAVLYRVGNVYERVRATMVADGEQVAS